MTQATRVHKAANLNALPIPVLTSSPSAPEVGFESRLQKFDTEVGPFNKSAGFFGPTSFSAVFLENEGNIDTTIQDSTSHLSPKPSLESPQAHASLSTTRDHIQRSTRITLGIKAIRQLPDHRTFGFLLARYEDNNYELNFHKPSIVHCAKSIFSTYNTYLKEPRRLDGLEHFAQLLCTNGDSTLEQPDDWESWLASFCGTKLRWESLGLVYGAMTSAILSLPERDPFFTTQSGQRNDRKAFALEMKDCVQACVTLSSHTDLINPLMVSLLVKNLLLQSVCSGDTSESESGYRCVIRSC